MKILSRMPITCNLLRMPACPRCNKRPAKRFCPALRTKICAVCCARERMIELPCPESCSYLLEARTNASHREHALRRQETAENPRDLMLSDAAIPILDAIGAAIASAMRRPEAPAFRGLDDSDVLAALEIAIKNFETEESGLIYEHRAGAAPIDDLSRRIRVHIDDIGKDAPADRRPGRSDILKGLMFTRASVMAHRLREQDDPESARSFIRYTVLFYPWPPETASPLIL